MLRTLHLTIALSAALAASVTSVALGDTQRLIVDDTAVAESGSSVAMGALPQLPSVDMSGYSESDFLPVRPAATKPQTAKPKSNGDLAKRLEKIINEWQGVPYKWGHNTKSGTDCSGFVQAAFRQMGVKLPHGSRYLATCNVGPVVKGELQYGDVLIWPGYHAAIYTGNGTTAETVRGEGVSRSTLRGRRPTVVRRFFDALRHTEGVMDAPEAVAGTPENAGIAALVDIMCNGGYAALKAKVEADPNAVSLADSSGATLLHWASDKGNVPCSRLLIEHGAKVGAAKTNGVTPLHVASALGRDEIVALLLASGADPNAEDRSGRTPLSLARQKGNESVVAILLADSRTSDESAALEPMTVGEDDGDGEGVPVEAGSDIVPMPVEPKPIRTTPPSPTVQTMAAVMPAEVILPTDEEALCLLEMANQERTRRGLAPLTYDSTAEAVAQSRADDIATSGVLSHDSPTRGTAADMLKKVGIASTRWTESVVACGSVSVAHASMMESENRGRTLTSDRYARAAIGVARGGRWGRVYVVLLGS